MALCTDRGTGAVRGGEGGGGTGALRCCDWACAFPLTIPIHRCVPQAVRQLEAENRALELRLAELQEEQENQACAIRDAKAEALDAADKGAATKAALQAAKAEAEALRGQIVSAPEAAVTALAEVQAAVERARGRVTAAEAQARAQHGRREALASLEKEIRKAIGVAGEAQHAVVQRKEASAVLKLAQQRMQENEAEGYRIESEQQHLERTLATLAERQARLEQQGELKVRGREAWGWCWVNWVSPPLRRRLTPDCVHLSAAFLRRTHG